MKSHIGGQYYDTFSFSYCFHPVVHEISHDEQMNNLGDHKPISHILRQNWGWTLAVEFIELSVGENPENDGNYSGYCLTGYEVRCVCLDLALLQLEIWYFFGEEN
jgi:hypothetical protein